MRPSPSQKREADGRCENQYFDTLLGDLGLRTQRKGGWFGEWFASYKPSDYGGVLQELMAKYYADDQD